MPSPQQPRPAPIIIRVVGDGPLVRHRQLPVLAQIGRKRLRLRREAGGNPQRENYLEPPSGVWPVAVWCTYAWSVVGVAHLTVDTRRGHPCVVYYTPPKTIHGSGTLSYQPGGHEPPSPSSALAHLDQPRSPAQRLASIGLNAVIKLVVSLVGFFIVGLVVLMMFYASGMGG